MLESAITKKILDALHKRGALARKTHGGKMQTRGRPDIEGIYPVMIMTKNGPKRIGIAFGIEVKQPGKKPTDLQAYELANIKSAGGFSCDADCVEKAMAILDEIEEYVT